MNIVRKIVLLSVIALSFAFSSNAQKVGYLNSGELLQQLPEWKQAQSNLEAFQTQLQKKGQGMVEAFQVNVNKLQEKQQSGDLSPKQLEVERNKLIEEQTKIEEFEREMQTQIYQKQEELLQPLLNKINTLINEVAGEQGYSYIFDASAGTGVILYSDETYNILPHVRTKLGLTDTDTPE